MSDGPIKASADYGRWLADIKQQFRQTQLKAAVRLNSELLQFYWQLGCDIVAPQRHSQWGDGFLTQFRHDLMAEGNLEQIRRWVRFWQDATIAKQPVSQLPEKDGDHPTGLQPAAQLTKAADRKTSLSWSALPIICIACKQMPLAVDGKGFYLGLLFYHLTLRCYVVIAFKTGDFIPEFAGRLNFYLTAVDKQFKQGQDAVSIGLLLWKQKGRLVAEYALSDFHKPMGIAEYQLTQSLLDNLKSSLPSIGAIEAELSLEWGNDDE